MNNRKKFIEKSILIHGDLYDYSKVVYVNNITKVCIIDYIHGEFWQKPARHKVGRGHPNRAEAKKRQTNLERYGCEKYTNREKAKKTNLERYGVEYSIQSLEIKDKIKEIKLEKYGCEKYTNREKAKKTNLERYGVEYSLQSKIVKEKAKKTNLERYGVEYPMQSEEIYNKVKTTNLKNYGVECGLQSKIIKEKIKRTNVERYGTTNASQKHISSENIEIFNNIILLSEFMRYKTLDEAAKLLGYTLSPLRTKCAENNISYIKQEEPIWEKELEFFLKQNNINYVKNDRVQIKPKELDFYLPDHNIAIELNGLYWHSTEYICKYYHLHKYNKCKDNNIQLIQIFEDEWICKKDIVLNRLKNKLKLHKPIMARKCIIKEIDNNSAQLFCNKYHIQGYAASSIRIGLFYDNLLVQVMTFSKSRFNKKYQYELIRLVSEKPVLGGAQKLFKYFLKTYNPENACTYCDLRWNTGNIYNKIGFKLVKQTEPDYYYIKRYVRINRISLQKHKLTKDQLLEKNQLNKIYGVGNSVWEWKCRPTENITKY